MMLDVIQGRQPHHSWLRHGGVETLESYNFDGSLDFLPPDHVEFLDSLGDFFEFEDYFFTHAAYDPDLPLTSQPEELLRWYSLSLGIPAPHINGKIGVVGHTANRDGEVNDYGHLICLDSYCYGGGWLSAMELRTRQLWQANEDGDLRKLFKQ
jgi:serine/threonine protein phosphatase 1